MESTVKLYFLEITVFAAFSETVKSNSPIGKQIFFMEKESFVSSEWNTRESL